MKELLFVALTTTSLFISCNKKDDINNKETLNEQDGEFMISSTHINLGEIKTGKLIQQKSIEPVIKGYAGLMISDHTAAQDQLSTIAHQWGMRCRP